MPLLRCSPASPGSSPFRKAVRIKPDEFLVLSGLDDARVPTVWFVLNRLTLFAVAKFIEIW
jgi:hypothetical protein